MSQFKFFQSSKLIKTFWPLYMGFFLVGSEMYIISPLLEVISSDLSVSISASAQLITSYVIIQAILGPFISTLYNRLGPRFMITIGIVIFSIGNILSALTYDYWLVICSRGIAGLGVAFFGPSTWVWISHRIEENLRGKAIAFGMASFALGQVLGVPIGAYSAAFLSWQSVLAILGIAAMLLLPSIWKRIPSHSSSAIEIASENINLENNIIKTLLSSWQDKHLRWNYIITFLFHSASLGAYSFLAIYLSKNFFIHDKYIGFIGILSGVGTFLGSLTIGFISERLFVKNKKRGIMFLVYCSLGGMIAVPLAFQMSYLILSVFFILTWFLFSGSFDSCQQHSVISLSKDNIPTNLSWNTSILYAASGVGVLIMSIKPESPNFIAVMAFVMMFFSSLSALYLYIKIGSIYEK
ncbi:hypothetical protein Xvie_01063 [Xenorhabdus vietnamensis]|uniref:Major facilitator superfamily (MFS) profile domain-containing protein n=1 Tax=Xenorhabdus vietnamensis TaxID=351656 RepID=A0A1Y2SIF0_9GAMM|nr:MFS transporter [Xenorhabdus vietnamensis]OTA17669.1 hypothetical protein Xvie_01063 [Xenorhabdus vietnamensis]